MKVSELLKSSLENFKSSWRAEKNRIAFRGGSYSLIMTAIVLAILIVANIFVSALPATLTKYDISSSKLYSITSNTKAVVNALKEDVTIYWIVQAGEEDQVIENLLGKYDSLSDRIEIVKKNPDIYPTFAKQYTDETVKNNSLVVECGDRSRFISYDDIYLQKTNMYSFSSSRSFDGEGAITSAIDYVTSEELPKLYALEGHGETELPETFSDKIEKENIEVESISLLKVDAIPEDADAVMIYGPNSDISGEERDVLKEYVKGGGKLLVMAGPTEEGLLENLYGILSEYGIKVNEGIVVEGDREHYAFRAPYMLLPGMESHEITDSLIEEKYYPIMPIASGLTVERTYGAEVTELLTTSDSSFSKIAGYSLTNFKREEGDIDGPFALAVAIKNYMDGEIVWFTSSNLLDDTYNAYSSGANVDMVMNALSSPIGEREAIAIRSKSLDYEYLTVSDSTSSLLKVLMIGVFPLLYLGFGIFVILGKRRMRNETI